MSSTPGKLLMERLPAEIVDQVANFADASDLSVVRTVNSVMEKTFWRAFVKSHISHRVCFVLDPARLRNLDQIASSKALSGELRSLTLTVSPLLPCSSANIQLAARESHFHSSAQAEAAAFLTVESDFLHPGPLDQPTIASILRKLKATGKCQLSLDLTTHSVWWTSCNRDMFDGFDGLDAIDPNGTTPVQFPRYQGAYEDLLRVVALDSKSEVKRITIDNKRCVLLEDYRLVQSLRRSVRALESLHIIYHSIVIEHCDNHPNFHHTTLQDPRFQRGQLFLLSVAEELRVLRFEGGWPVSGYGCDGVIQPDVQSVANLLLIRPLPFLVELHLEQMFLPQCVLFALLHYCGRTLRRLTFREVTLDATSWRGVFLFVRQMCPVLEELEFKGLFTRHPSGEYPPVVFDVERRSKSVHDPPPCRYFEDAVIQYSATDYFGLSARGSLSVQARLSSLGFDHDHLEVHQHCYQLVIEDGVVLKRNLDPQLWDSGVVSESYGQWLGNGNGNPDRFGIQRLLEICDGHRRYVADYLAGLV